MSEKLYKKCLRCHRLLKTNKARLLGYGQHCWKEHLKEIYAKNSLFAQPIIKNDNKDSKN